MEDSKAILPHDTLRDTTDVQRSLKLSPVARTTS